MDQQASADAPTDHPTEREVQAFLSSGSFSQLFKDRSPNKTPVKILSVFDRASDTDQPPATENAGEHGSLRSEVYNQRVESEINVQKKLMGEKDGIIKRQEVLAKQQSIYSYSYLRGLRMCIENCARVTDTETILRTVFVHGSDLDHLLDCLVQTLLMWLPEDFSVAGGLRNVNVESQVIDAVLFIVFLTRNEVHALRVVQKYGVLVWRMMAFLSRPIMVETVNTSLNQSVMLCGAEVQNGLLSVLQHLVMHNLSCRVLLNDILACSRFPGGSGRNKSLHRRQSAVLKRHIVVILVPVLAKIAMRSSFTRAVELSLTVLTTIGMQVDSEWGRHSNANQPGTGVADGVAFANLKFIRYQFRIAVACSLNPVNVHRLEEQWSHVTPIRTALHAFADVMHMPKPLASLVVTRQENGDPDSEVWQQYEFEDTGKPVDVVDADAEPLDVEELERPMSSLMPPVSEELDLLNNAAKSRIEDIMSPIPSLNTGAAQLSTTITAPRTSLVEVPVQNQQRRFDAILPNPSAARSSSITSARPSVMITAPRTVLTKVPVENQWQQRQLEAVHTTNPPAAGSFRTEDAQPSVMITAPRTSLAKVPVENHQTLPTTETNPATGGNSVRKRLFYDDFDADSNNTEEDGSGDGVAVSNPALNDPAFVQPTPVADRTTLGSTYTVTPKAREIAAVTKPQVVRIAPPVSKLPQYPLVYRKAAERTVLDARSPTNASISFRNGGGNKQPSQRDRGSQDIRNFMQPRTSAALSPHQVLDARQQRNAAAELHSTTGDALPRSPATTGYMSNVATRGSYNSASNNSRFGHYAGNFSAQSSGKKKNNKRFKNAPVISPVRAHIGPPVLAAQQQQQPADNGPAGFLPFEGFPASVLMADDDGAGDGDGNPWDGYNQGAVENMFADNMHNPLNRSDTSNNADGDLVQLEPVFLSPPTPAAAAATNKIRDARIIRADSFDMEDFSTQAALRGLRPTAGNTGGGADDDDDIYLVTDAGMPPTKKAQVNESPPTLHRVINSNDTQHQEQAVNDIAANFSTQQLFGGGSAATTAVSKFPNVGTRATPILGMNVVNQVQQQLMGGGANRRLAPEKGVSDEPHRWRSGSDRMPNYSGNAASHNLHTEGDGALQREPPVCLIPIDYVVDTVYGSDDDGSRSNDIIPLRPQRGPAQPTGAAAPVTRGRAPYANVNQPQDESDDAVQVLLETFTTQNAMRSANALAAANRMASTRGMLGRGGGPSLRGRGGYN